MEVVQPPYADVWIEVEECARIRDELRRLGHDYWADRFSGSEIGRLLEGWALFVDTDWTKWDVSEYSNDIGVRNQLEIVLQTVGPASRDRLLQALAPLDAIFKSRMRPAEAGDSSRAQFWIANTIWSRERSGE